MQAAPRSRLNPAFVRAVLAHPKPNHVLASEARFSQSQHFSSLLHAQFVVPSLKTVARLQIVATLVGYSGPILLEEYPPVTNDTFDADPLPRPR